MSTKFFILLGVIFHFNSFAQNHDNVWTFGYTNMPCDSTSDFGETNLYFDEGEISSNFVCRQLRFAGNSNASISDKSGELKLIFNGCQLRDAQDEFVEGSDILVRNDTNIEQTWWCRDGYKTRQKERSWYCKFTPEVRK